MGRIGIWEKGVEGFPGGENSQHKPREPECQAAPQAERPPQALCDFEQLSQTSSLSTDKSNNIQSLESLQAIFG